MRGCAHANTYSVCMRACVHVNSKQKHHVPMSQRCVIKYNPLRYMRVRVSVCVCACVHGNRRFWHLIANDRRPRQNFECKQEKGKCRHCRSHVNFPCIITPYFERFMLTTNAEKCNSHLFAPHIAKNYSWEFIIMQGRPFIVHSPRTISLI